MRNVLLAASKYAVKNRLIEVDLVSIMAAPSGLSINQNGEIYVATNQQTPPGDGKRYDLNPRDRRIRSIQANFRYPLNTPALSAFWFGRIDTNGTIVSIDLGLYDDWNSQNGFRLVDDTHNRTVVTASWNGVLKKTFDTPVRQQDLVVKIGGRNGYAYAPIYFKDLIIELE